MILHLVKHSPALYQSLSLCVTELGQNDGLVLLEDGVYALSADLLPQLRSLADKGLLYYMVDDSKARALQPQAGQGLNYCELVELCLQYDKTMSW